MLTEANLRNPILINTLGHSAGLLLFGFIIFLLFRDRRTHAVPSARLPLTAAFLAFGWNAGSLIALAMGNVDSDPMLLTMTASFAVLSLLPAVLLQLALQGRLPLLSAAGYTISGLAVLLHTAELFTHISAPHQAALLLTAGGFTALSAIALLTAKRKRTEWLSFACLLLFAASFPHFGYQHLQSPWTAEIAWHHIGIPVALIVLLRDYRFLLLDAFIRFLMNALLAAAYATVLLFAARQFNPSGLALSDVFLMGITLVSACLSLIVFVHVRNGLERWISGVIFRRQDTGERIRNIAKLASQARTEQQLITEAAREVAAHLRATRFAVVPETALGFASGQAPGHALDRPSMLSPGAGSEYGWAEAQAPLRLSGGETQVLLTGPRRGRQRYLSEDLEDLRLLASVLVEQVERFRSEELRRLVTQAELRALQAQMNPHFLFNAFNTLYGTIDRAAVEARRLVLNLTEIFRYFLQDGRSVIAFSEELRIVRSYLEIEALRLGERLETRIDVDPTALPVLVPVLSLQPLVENAVKHGVASRLGKGSVQIQAGIEAGSLRIIVQDRFSGATGFPGVPDGSGLALANVRRRLSLSYGAAATLTVSHAAEGCSVLLVIPLASRIEVAS